MIMFEYCFIGMAMMYALMTWIFPIKISEVELKEDKSEKLPAKTNKTGNYTSVFHSAGIDIKTSYADCECGMRQVKLTHNKPIVLFNGKKAKTKVDVGFACLSCGWACKFLDHENPSKRVSFQAFCFRYTHTAEEERIALLNQESNLLRQRLRMIEMELQTGYRETALIV